MINPIIRFRRAIHLNDLPLVKRILKNNPSVLASPDLDDGGNTPLHLAARLGLVDIAVSFGVIYFSFVSVFQFLGGVDIGVGWVNGLGFMLELFLFMLCRFGIF